ncbi:MAG: UPF0489 family protein [Candidatus Uhrbacteria bacterium]
MLDFKRSEGEFSGLEKRKPPEVFRKFYVEENGRFVNRLYLQPEEKKWDGSVIPKLIIGNSIEDVVGNQTKIRYSFPVYDEVYDDYGYPMESVYSKEGGGLEKYLVFFTNDQKPIYVFDNHNHALFAWQESIEAGQIKKGFTLLRIDAHDDLVPPFFELQESLEQNWTTGTIRRKIGNSDSDLNIKNFTVPALRVGIIGRMLLCLNAVDSNDRFKCLDVSADAKELVEQSRLEFEIFFVSLKQGENDLVLDVDFDIFKKLRIKPEILLDRIVRLISVAKAVTFATSPVYYETDEAIKKVKEVLSRVL